MIVLFLSILIWTNAIDGNHFDGGTITWTPIYPNSTSSSVPMTITQSYSWVYPTVHCLTDVPISTGGTYGNSNDNLTCVANCSTQNGYSTQVISILTDCISYSSSLKMLTSEKSNNITLDTSTYFWIAFRGRAWRSLENAATNNNPGWSLVSLIDLQRRPDGLINTSPVAHVTSPQYVIVNRTTTIQILVSDVNADDDVRCRWALKNSSSGADECDDVCYTGYASTPGYLSNCTLAFTPTKAGVWYAIAIQVEDFINTTSTSPMSSVPVQFLIYVLPIPNCSQVPVIIPLTDCLEVEVNVPVTFPLYAMNYCNRTTSIITDLISTNGITGMSVSSLVNSTTNTSLVYVTLTWTPQTNQIGSQQFCAVAYTNEKVQSDPYCVTFTVTTSKPCTTTTTTQTTTTSTSTPSQTMTTTTSTQTTTTATIVSTATTSTTETTTTTAKAAIATLMTTITCSSNQITLILIVCLPVFAFLLCLCCCCWCLYYLRWIPTAHCRRLFKREKDSWLETDTFATEEDITNNRSNTIETISTSTIGNERINNVDTIRGKKIIKPPKVEYAWVKSYQQQNSDSDMFAVEKQLRSQHSTTPVSTVKKPLRVSEIIKDNEARIHHEENEFSSTSLSRIYVGKFPRNNVAPSSNPRANLRWYHFGFKSNHTGVDKRWYQFGFKPKRTGAN